MASISALAERKAETDHRARVALAQLAERAGTEAPEVGAGRLTDHSHHEAARIVADSAVVAFLAETLATLASEIDALKGAKRGGK
jgi:hypothetical protein